MKTETSAMLIRNVPKTLRKQLKALANETDTSLNALVISAMAYCVTHPQTATKKEG